MILVSKVTANDSLQVCCQGEGGCTSLLLLQTAEEHCTVPFWFFLNYKLVEGSIINAQLRLTRRILKTGEGAG